MVLYKMGLRKLVTRLLPETWYAASYYRRGAKIIVTRIARAFYEEVENPGVGKVSFRTGKRKYAGLMDTMDVRKRIEEVVNDQ